MTAPTGPWDQPCAMFAASVATTPSASKPAGQGRDREPVPRRVEVHHRAGVDEAVDRGGLQPGGDAGLEPAFVGDASATPVVDALLPQWFALVRQIGGNRRVALRIVR